MAGPTLLTFTVMRNEGPFILEWVAYQRLMGVDSILVLTNDCTDGTDVLLDRLDELGIVRHLPNPAPLVAQRTGKHQPPHVIGFTYAKGLREWREADFIFLSDVDEFPVVRVGDGTLRGLMEVNGWPDVISMTEAIFGTGDVLEYNDRLVTETFTRRCNARPGRWKARRGLKSITRNDPRIFNIRNHRPLVDPAEAPGLRWLDGSGRDFPMEIRSVHQKGMDCRGATDHVVLNHYTLRSLESFLVKNDRGDAVAPSRLSMKYFRRRNLVEDQTTEIHAHLPALRDEIARLKADGPTAHLHEACVAAHRQAIERLRGSALHTEILAHLDGREPAPA